MIFIQIEVQKIDNLYAEAIEAIALTLIPAVAEMDSHAWGQEIYACLISKDDFEQVWNSRTTIKICLFASEMLS